MPTRPRFFQRPAQRKTSKPRTEPFHAVEIQYKSDACLAAKAVRGKRYLASAAPIFPLEGCTRPEKCQCGYRHHSDRRHGPRRNVDGALPTQSKIGVRERRNSRKRRAEDRDFGLEEKFGLQAEPEPLSLDDSYYNFVDTARLKRLKED